MHQKSQGQGRLPPLPKTTHPAKSQRSHPVISQEVTVEGAHFAHLHFAAASPDQAARRGLRLSQRTLLDQELKQLGSIFRLLSWNRQPVVLKLAEHLRIQRGEALLHGLPCTSSLGTWPSIKVSMNLAARGGKGEAPLCTRGGADLAGVGRALRMRSSSFLNSASLCSCSALFFSASRAAAAEAFVSLRN